MEVPGVKVGSFHHASISPTQPRHEPDWETVLDKNQFSLPCWINLEPVSSITPLLSAQRSPREHTARKEGSTESLQIDSTLILRDHEIQHKLPKLGKINKRGSSCQGSLESIQWVSAQSPTALVTMHHCSGEVGPDLSKGPKCIPALLRSHHSKHYVHSLAATIKTSSSSQVYHLFAQCC